MFYPAPLNLDKSLSNFDDHQSLLSASSWDKDEQAAPLASRRKEQESYSSFILDQEEHIQNKGDESENIVE